MSKTPESTSAAGQYVVATINIPPPDDVVEIRGRCPGGRRQAELGVCAARRGQAPIYDAARPRDPSLRAHGIRASTPIPKDEQLTALEAEEGLLPQEPLRPGERVLLAGSVELKRVVIDLESRPREQADERLAKAKVRDRPWTSSRHRSRSRKRARGRLLLRK